MHAENERRDGTDQLGKPERWTRKSRQMNWYQGVRGVYWTRTAAVMLRYDGEKGSGRKEGVKRNASKKENKLQGGPLEDHVKPRYL